MPNVALQVRVGNSAGRDQLLYGRLRARRLADSGINASRLPIRRIGCEEDRIVEIIGGTRYVELAVFYVAPHVHTDLHVMVSMTNRNHVRVGVDVFLEELGVAVVGAESHGPVIKPSCRDTALASINQGNVLRIARLEFVQYGSAKGMNPAQLTVGGPTDDWIGKSAGASCGARPKIIGRAY